MNIARESYALVLICLADLVSTIFFVSYRSATEGNPLMAYYLSHSLGAFVGIKLVLCLMPLFLMEYARQRRPRSARLGLRVALAGYLLSYAAGVSQLNPPDPMIHHSGSPSSACPQYHRPRVGHYAPAQMIPYRLPARTASANLPAPTDR